MTTKLHCIYVLLDENQKVFYVGKTNRPKIRLNRHIGDVRKGSRLYVHNKLRQVLMRKGWNKSGIFKVIEKDVPENLIDEREIFHIKAFKDTGIKLTNLTDGGEGGKGFTPEIIERIAAKHRGRQHSEEWKRHISESKKGISLSLSHRKALKKAWKTRPPMSRKTREKIIQSTRGNINTKKFVVLSPEGISYVTERGLSDFCREHGLDVSNLHSTISGRRKQHRGWKIVSETS